MESNSTPIRLRFLIGMCMLFAGANTFATSLTFETNDCTTDGCLVNQDYGDRVTGTSNSTGFFGAAGGDTPNVTVEYDGENVDQLSHWRTGYNELTNVLYNERDGDSFFSVTLTADAGFEVILESVDIGNFGSGDIGLPAIQALDQSGMVLQEFLNLSLNGTDRGPSTQLVFTAAIGSVVELLVSTADLGGSSDNIGLDNIVFSQQAASPVPLPAAAWLLMSALGGLLGMKKLRPAT